jgi:hypothetical protein
VHPTSLCSGFQAGKPSRLFAIPSAAPSLILSAFLFRRVISTIPPAPFSGPPSYATLALRFSDSSPSPISFFSQKRANEAVERGEFVDVHDIGGVDPKDHDVLITDMNNETLKSEISELVGIPYLREATKDEADKVAEEIRGFTHGWKRHQMLPCVLGIGDMARWVFFIVDPVVPIDVHLISGKCSSHIGRMPWPRTQL